MAGARVFFSLPDEIKEQEGDICALFLYARFIIIFQMAACSLYCSAMFPYCNDANKQTLHVSERELQKGKESVFKR